MSNIGRAATTINFGSFHKLEFPKFEGDDFCSWVMQNECFSKVEETPPKIKVKIAASQLRRRALQRQLVTYDDWELYKQNMGPRFGAPIHDDPLLDLRNL